MRIISLRLKNYRKFRDVSIEFGDGIIAITGLNGAGKSTIVEAIAWALYGNHKRITRKGDSKEGIRSVNAAPSDITGAYLEFEIDGNNYSLAREMRGKAGSMVVEIKENGVGQASGNRPVSKFVEKKIGLDAEGFLTSVFARQKELSALSDPQPEKRRKKIEKMLGLDAIDSARDMIKADKKEINSTLKALKDGVFDASGSPVANSIKADIEVIEREVSHMKKELSDKRKEHEGLKSELESMTKEVEALRSKEREHSGLNAEIREIGGEIKAKKSEISGLEKEREKIGKLKKKASELEEDAHGYAEKMAELNAMRDEREKYLKKMSLEEKRAEYRQSIEEKKSEIRRIEGELEGIEIPDLKEIGDRIKELKSRKKGLEKKIGELEGNTKALKRQVKKLRHDREIIEEEGPESKCPTCHRRLGDDFQGIIDEIGFEISDKEMEMKMSEKEIERLAREISEIEGKIDRAEDERRKGERNEERMRSLKKELERYEKEMSLLEERLKDVDGELSALGEVKFDDERFSKLKKDVKELEEKNRIYLQIKAEIKRENQVKERISDLKKEIEAMESKLSALNKNLKQLDFSENLMRKREKELADIRERERALADSVLSLEKDIRNTEDRENSKKERLGELEKKMDKIAEYEEELRYLSKLEVLLRDFRSGAILKIRPALQDIASNLFSSMTDGKYSGIEIDDDYNIRIIDVGGSYPIGRFSGGEEDLANLCLRLAISEVVVKVRGASGINFLVLDEIFGSQDPIRRENILRALQSLSNRFHQIFLISHIDVMGESRSMVLNVRENENGESTIKVD